MNKNLSPIPQTSPPIGHGRWNTWAVVTGVPEHKEGICCYENTAPKGHGGRVGYLFFPGDLLGLRCCERHGKSERVVASGGTWTFSGDMPKGT